MLVVVTVKLWDVEGEGYVGGSSPFCFVNDINVATRFDLCSKAWEAFASLRILGNVEKAWLVEVSETSY
jgi:hypothetical protein